MREETKEVPSCNLMACLSDSLIISHRIPSKNARQRGLEPLTYCLEGSCSIQLSYWRQTIKPYHDPLRKEKIFPYS